MTSSSSEKFSYVYIPYDMRDSIEEKCMKIPRGKEVECLIDTLKEHFQRRSPSRTFEQMAAQRKELTRNLPEGTTVDDSLLETAAAMQLVETVALLSQSKKNGFVGVNMYVDDSGSLKNLPRNIRATELAHCCGRPIDVKGDAFLARVMDNGDDFQRMDFNLSEMSSNAEWVKLAQEQAAAQREGESPESVLRRIGAVSSESAQTPIKELSPAESAKEDGNTAFKKGDFHEAISLYGKALAIDDNLTAARNNRAMAFIKLEKWKEALDDCKQVLELQPSNVKALLRAATATVELGNRDQAKKYLEDTLQIEPRNSEAAERLKKLKET